MSDSTMGELKATIKQMKRNRAWGPDDVPIESYTWLDEEALETILTLLNNWWRNIRFPMEKMKANIASIYKKGNPKSQENYRPISRLSSIYNI